MYDTSEPICFPIVSGHLSLSKIICEMTPFYYNTVTEHLFLSYGECLMLWSLRKPKIFNYFLENHVIKDK